MRIDAHTKLQEVIRKNDATNKKIYQNRFEENTQNEILDSTNENYQNYSKLLKNRSEEEKVEVSEWINRIGINQMEEYYSGNSSKEQLLNGMIKACTEMFEFYTNEYDISINQMCEEDKLHLLQQTYVEFKRGNNIAAVNQCKKQGTEYAAQYGNSDDWRYVFYDSKYYYESENLEKEIKNTISELAKKIGIENLNYEEMEEPYKAALCDGMNFNITWNFRAESTCTIKMMETDLVPPKDFAFFYQNCTSREWDANNLKKSQKGIFILNYKDKQWLIDVPFDRYTSNDKDIVEHFNLKNFFEKYSIGKKENDESLLNYLSKMNIFTVQWYKKHYV